MVACFLLQLDMLCARSRETSREPPSSILCFGGKDKWSKVKRMYISIVLACGGARE